MLEPWEVVTTESLLLDCLDKLTILGLLLPQSPSHKTSRTQLGSAEVFLEHHVILPEEFSKFAQSDKHTEYMWKLCKERDYMETTLTDLLHEINTNGTFNHLLQIVEQERLKKLEYLQMLIKEEKRKAVLQGLRNQPQILNKTLKEEIIRREEYILYLKDRLLEAKKNVTGKEKYTSMQLRTLLEQENKKQCQEISNWESKIKKIKEQINEENETHTKTMNFLKKSVEVSEEILKFWENKYSEKVSNLEKVIMDLKETRSNLAEKNELITSKSMEYSKLIEEDKAVKLKATLEREDRERRLRSTILIQSWWRAVMVRNFLGEYKGLKKVFKSKIVEKKKKGKQEKKQAKSEKSNKQNKSNGKKKNKNKK